MLREVLSYQGQPAAVFVDAANEAEFSGAVSRVLTDRVLSDGLRQSAVGLKSRYSLDAMIEEYVRILGDAVGADTH